ncbi:MAG TPA: glycosyltransferase family 2 protein [Methylocella sp.]|nr:glycosyltransferase family 2 protein [Methylocella sp.]
MIMNAVIDVLFVGWGAIAVLSTISAWRYTWGLPLIEIPGTTPPAAVIVAVKNASDVSRAFFDRLRHQAYPDFRIIAAVESEEDPAFAMVTEESNRPGPPIRTVVAGQSGRTGQKVWNLLAGLDAIEPSDEIVAFVDSDTLPAPEWLSRLVAALVNTGREAVTGYRWIIPADNRVSSAVVAAANASIVTVPRLPSIINHCWGGTMAMRRKTLEHIDIRRYWAGAISDDAQMTRAFKEAGYDVYSPRQNLLLSPVAMSWSEALSFGRRQYRILCLHSPDIWALAALGTFLPIAAGIAALSMALQGSVLAIVLIGVSLVLGEVRYHCRRKIVIALWGEATAAGHKNYWRVERWLRPIWWSFHALCVFSALGSRNIRWAGIDYRIRGPQEVEVSRPPAAEP